MKLLFSFCVFTLFLNCIAYGASEKPNIVLIFSDDQGWNDVGCYGSEIATPNIDRIAAEGIKFTNFYSASSICTPSRFGLLTGRNPRRSRHQLLSALMFMADEHKLTGIQPDETTIAEVLRDQAGYETAILGKWHLGHGAPELLPVNHGFDFFRGHTGGCIDYFTMTYGNIPDWYHGLNHVSENGYATELITDEAVEFISMRSESEEPFFLYLAYNAPHFGKGYSPKDKAPVNIMQAQGSDLKRVSFIEDKVRREFAAMTTSLDDGVGRVLASLDESGLEENTLVIFLSDHGGDPTYGGSNKPLRGNKATLFEGGIRVPCVMRWPGRIKSGQTSESLAWSLDLFPTFCALAGIDDIPNRELLDGIDLSSLLLEGKPTAEERMMFWETGSHQELKRKGWRAYREGNYKYLHSPKDGEFLFDLATDPNEENDLSTAQADRFGRMREAANQLSKQYRESVK